MTRSLGSAATASRKSGTDRRILQLILCQNHKLPVGPQAGRAIATGCSDDKRVAHRNTGLVLPLKKLDTVAVVHLDLLGLTLRRFQNGQALILAPSQCVGNYEALRKFLVSLSANPCITHGYVATR